VVKKKFTTASSKSGGISWGDLFEVFSEQKGWTVEYIADGISIAQICVLMDARGRLNAERKKAIDSLPKGKGKGGGGKKISMKARTLGDLVKFFGPAKVKGK